MRAIRIKGVAEVRLRLFLSTVRPRVSTVIYESAFSTNKAQLTTKIIMKRGDYPGFTLAKLLDETHIKSLEEGGNN
jgi:hypothetical protein